jgi:hypothetical protein
VRRALFISGPPGSISSSSSSSNILRFFSEVELCTVFTFSCLFFSLLLFSFFFSFFFFRFASRAFFQAA